MKFPELIVDSTELSEMTISVNNKSVELTQAGNITSVFRHLQLHETSGMAVAVNYKVVPKSEWDTHMLHPHDKVTIIRATQGG